VDGFPVWINIAITFVIANLLFHIIYLLDHRTKTEGILFSQPPSLKLRIYAGLLGIILGGWFIIILLSGLRISGEMLLLPIGSVALFGYSIGIDKPLQQIQNAYANVFHNFIRSKKIIGIEGKTIDEIILAVNTGGRFVVYEYCISPLIVTLDYDSNVHFINIDNKQKILSVQYSIISLLFGWESLFGVIHTIRCLMVNLRGGKDITKQVVEWLKFIQEMSESTK
jgi:hypothetical protein